MTPKLEEQLIQQELQQEQQLALLAAIIFVGREVATQCITSKEDWELEAKVCTQIADCLIKAAGKYVAE